ncbi:MAG: 50S ribosomal protein L17 [SAR202 cluster bacterium]|mgnify:FL=1|nr:50S ribosomal protein L17 [SAR202 cluster bacterium]
MRHRIAGRKLSRPTAHRMSMLRTAVTDLLRHETLQTTDAKAREIRRMAEKVITRGKTNTLHSRRLAAAVLRDKKVLSKLFDELGTRYEDRPGGYTRIVKLGNRKGDAAPMAIIELMP